jgi:flagellin-like protein
MACPLLHEIPVKGDQKKEMRLFAKPTRSIIPVSRKGISPVIATVILVAVTITVSVSIAYWMGGISGSYTRMEKIEVVSVSVSRDIYSGDYTISFGIRNTGPADATVNMVYINGRAYDSFIDKVYLRESDGTWISSGFLDVPVSSGSSKTILMRIAPASGTMTFPPFTSGTTLDVNLHTAAGKDNPQMIILN